MKVKRIFTDLFPETSFRQPLGLYINPDYYNFLTLRCFWFLLTYVANH